MSDETYAIETVKLTKIFITAKKKKTAVADLSLQIKSGEIFGLLGPNGAGKTTTLRMLTNLLKPTSGKIFCNGRDFTANPRDMLGNIGVVSQHLNFDRDLTVYENMDLHARLHHLPSTERSRRIDELLDYVELAERRNDNVMKLSGGMQRRLIIARALIHRPRILYLDEPTVALDPQIRRMLHDLFRRLSRDGVTIFITTHYIEEAQSICHRVAIMNHGHIVALDSPAALTKRLGEHAVEWEEDNRRQYRFFDNRMAARQFAATNSAGEVIVRATNLEDVFIELTGQEF